MNENDRKLPADLTDKELERAVRDLILFDDFTLYSERDVDQSTGLVFALEMQACSLGLVNHSLNTDPNYDSAQMMIEFVGYLDRRARQLGLPKWSTIRHSLPYIERPSL